MTTDPIQHLRELLAKASLPPNDATAALIRALPALLAVAEAARNHEIVRERMPSWDEYEASRKVLQDALAKLDEVKP